MTQSRYLERRVSQLERLEAKHRQTYSRFGLSSYLVHALEPVELRQARFNLRKHIDAKVRPSFTDMIWRSKRDGGPYRLGTA